MPPQIDMEAGEHRRLLDKVREWFDDTEQVSRYVSASVGGPTSAETDLLNSLPPPPAAVVDVGCGAGRIALPLAEQGYCVTGVDVSVGMVAAARAAVGRRSTARFLAVEPCALPFAANSFEAALAVKLYCYIPSQQSRIDYLSEVSRVLRPNAVLLLTSYVVPTEAEALDALGADDGHKQAMAEFSTLEPLDTFVEGRGFVHWFTTGGLLAELSETAFAVEDVQDDPDNRQVLVRMRTRVRR